MRAFTHLMNMTANAVRDFEMDLFAAEVRDLEGVWGIGVGGIASKTLHLYHSYHRSHHRPSGGCACLLASARLRHSVKPRCSLLLNHSDSF